MIARPARRKGFNPAKAQPAEIKFIDKDINDANRAVFSYPIFKPFR